jgi:hypothetical protein
MDVKMDERHLDNYATNRSDLGTLEDEPVFDCCKKILVLIA